MEVRFMPSHGPAALDSAALARRLQDLVGDERRIQVDFLLHLDEFDRRQAFLPLGFGSLWDYCLKELHLREGAAGRRIGAMRVLRRFPGLEAPLRDGRLCLSTASLLGPVLTDDNLDDLVGRAAFLTKSDVEHLVASVRPREAPRPGIRKLVESPTTSSAAIELTTAAFQLAVPSRPPDDGGGDVRVERPSAVADDESPRPAQLQAVSRDQWSLRVTLDAALRDDLETLKILLSHKLPIGDLTELLREAVRCAIEKHGKRRGAVQPQRARGAAAASRPTSARAIPAAVRRQIWERDGGRCTFQAEDGRRCESRWQLEFDHVESAARGGPPTADNLRLRCRRHNILHAGEVFGREHMARFRRNARRPSRTGEFAIAGDSD
jgi:5-methylcytosine-specific restriction endonuclease McrA